MRHGEYLLVINCFCKNLHHGCLTGTQTNLTEQMCPLSFLFNFDNFMKDLCGVLTFMDGSPKQFV